MTRLDFLNADGNSFLVWVRFSDEDDDDLRLERCGDVEIAPDFGHLQIHALDSEIDGAGVHDALLGYPQGYWHGVSAAMEWGVAPKQPFLLSGRIDYDVFYDYYSGGHEADVRLAVAVVKRDTWTPERVRDEWEAFLADRCIAGAIAAADTNARTTRAESLGRTTTTGD